MLKHFWFLFLVAGVLSHNSTRAQNLARFSNIKPGMQDGDIERRAVKIANQRAWDLRCPEDYTKAIIISHKWKHELDRNGFVTGRVIHLELYCERPDGKCGMADFIFKQKHLGEGAYTQRLFFVAMGDMVTIDCE